MCRKEQSWDQNPRPLGFETLVFPLCQVEWLLAMGPTEALV